MFYLESFQWVLINSDKPEIFSERFKVWKPNIKSKKQMWFEFCSSHFKNWLPYITGSQIWQWQAASVLCGQTIPALFIALRARMPTDITVVICVVKVTVVKFKVIIQQKEDEYILGCGLYLVPFLWRLGHNGLFQYKLLLPLWVVVWDPALINKLIPS